MAKKIIKKTSKTKTPKKKTTPQKTIEPYEHKGKERMNNPLVGFGQWAWAVSLNPADLPDTLQSKNM